MPESLQKLCRSWTRSSTMFLNESPLKPLVSLTTTSDPPSHRVKSRLLCAWSCPVNWLNTLSPKAPKPWRSTPAQNKRGTASKRVKNLSQTALFRATNIQTRNTCSKVWSPIFGENFSPITNKIYEWKNWLLILISCFSCYPLLSY